MGRRSLTLALVSLSAVVALSAPMARAAAPTITQINLTLGPMLVTGFCSFDISQTTTFIGTQTDFTDQSGNLTRTEYHLVEQDTFNANGHQLVSDPYRTVHRLLFDSSGNLIHHYVTAQFELVTLPDGSVFRSAGRADFIDSPQGSLNPDNGLSGNVDAFCAALAA